MIDFLLCGADECAGVDGVTLGERGASEDASSAAPPPSYRVRVRLRVGGGCAIKVGMAILSESPPRPEAARAAATQEVARAAAAQEAARAAAAQEAALAAAAPEVACPEQARRTPMRRAAMSS